MTSTSLWLIAALVCLIAEFMSGTFTLLVIALALAGGGLASMLGAGDIAQLSAASLTGVAGFVLLWRWRRHRPLPPRKTDDPDLGQPVRVLHCDPQGQGRVHYRGADWEARFIDYHPATGETGVIAGRDGNRLHIAPPKP